jgi:hypothetical protein
MYSFLEFSVYDVVLQFKGRGKIRQQRILMEPICLIYFSMLLIKYCTYISNAARIHVLVQSSYKQ